MDLRWFLRKKSRKPPVTGLILPGGGARNAYQVGVLKGIAELLPDAVKNPFPVVCGTSSGALNAVFLASCACQFKQGVTRLHGVWENFHVGKVFRADTLTAIRTLFQWPTAFVTGGFREGRVMSLLDNGPLREHLESHIRMARIQHAIDSGALRAVAVTASGYSSGFSVTFYQGIDGLVPWERTRRRGVPTELTIDHLMASTGIPAVFPAVKLGNEFFGDGSMRESAPLSPALHLGADRLLIVGVRSSGGSSYDPEEDGGLYPSLGQITGYVFDTLFLDSLDADIERMTRINHTISETRERRVEFEDTALRPIEFLMISPSVDLREVVEHHVHRLPFSVRMLLHGFGALTRGGRELISYLLFEAPYCRELIDIGYRDAMNARADILQLLDVVDERDSD